MMGIEIRIPVRDKPVLERNARDKDALEAILASNYLSVAHAEDDRFIELVLSTCTKQYSFFVLTQDLQSAFRLLLAE